MAIPLGGVAASLGSALGTGLSQPIEQGLDRLAQQKLYDLQLRYQQAAQQAERERQASAFEPYVGAQTSQFLANLSPKERERAFQNLGALMQLQPQSQSALGMQALAQPQGVPKYQGGSQQQGTTNLLQELFTSPQDRRENEKLNLRKQQLEQQRELAERKMQLLGEQQTEKLAATAREFSEPYIRKAEAAEKNIRDYNALIKLAQTGKLRAGTSNIILKGLGIDKLGQNYETQLAEKLIGRLAQNAPAVFGTGRFTNYMEQTFQRSIPALTNTKEGIIALSKINLLADKAELIKNKVRSEIIKENNGRLPYDLADQINERSRPQIEELENEGFKILNPFAPTQNIQGAGLNEGPFTLTPIEQEGAQQESTLSNVGRHVARSAARTAESIIGLPGDIVGGLEGLGNVLTGATIGKKIFPEKTIFPTSEDIRESITKPLTGKYLEPQGSAEKFADDVIGDAATIFIPFKGKFPRSLTTIGKALGIAGGKSAVSNTARWAAEEVTGSPTVGAVAKLGTLAFGGMLGNRKALGTLKDKSYEKATAALPENAVFDISPEYKRLQTLSNTIANGDRPDKAFLLERLKHFEEAIPNPEKANIKGLVDLKQDWNKHIYESPIAPSAGKILGKAVGDVNEAIGRYGKTNPEFYNNFKMGDELTAAMKTQGLINQFMHKHKSLQDAASNHLIKQLLWAGPVAYFAPKMVGGAAASGYAIDRASRLAIMLAKSPAARQFYKNSVTNILANDVKGAARNIARLNAEADKFEKSNQLP